MNIESPISYYNWKNPTNEITFENIAFPLVRRVFANVLGNELIPVQPMDPPDAFNFVMDFWEGRFYEEPNILDIKKPNTFKEWRRIKRIVDQYGLAGIRKGSEYMDPGFVFAPYIPMLVADHIVVNIRY